MLQASWYLLKVILCSGILLGYYWLMLRNKIYHHYNRFFLLASVVLSLTLPLLTIHITHEVDLPQSQAIQLLQAVDSATFLNEIATQQNPSHIAIVPFLTILYALVSLLLLVAFIRVLWIVRSLIYKYKGQIVERFFFVNTNAKGTPFSFFNYIFWNEAIDLESHTGRQIFKHEVAHVQERHSYDKIFINLLLVVFWSNPFFWLIRKELNMIHEFIADRKAVEDNDTAGFAAMILQAAYPKHRFELTNNFFYSPIKRRLLMLTKNQNPKVSYISRIMVLPLAALVFAAFTFKAKPVYAKQETGRSELQPITIVLDAGHGGKDVGAYGPNGELEKDLTLAIVQKVKALYSGNQINWVLTRNEDVYLSPLERVNFCKEQKADLFISIHLDAAQKGAKINSGLTVYIAREGYPNTESSKLLASGVIGAFKSNYSLLVNPNPTQRQMGVMVLQNNTCPSVLIEAGYISNGKDVAYLQTEAAQTAIAQNILTAITNYQSSQAYATPTTDTVPEEKVIVKKVSPSRGKVKGAKPTEGAVNDLDSIPPGDIKTVDVNKPKNYTRITKINGQVISISHQPIELASKVVKPAPLYVLNGTVLTDGGAKFKNINPNDIKHINILKDDNAVKYYGEKGRNGVIEINTKIPLLTVPEVVSISYPKGKNVRPQPTMNTQAENKVAENITDNAVFIKAENEVNFVGGQAAWAKYLQEKLDPTIAVNEGWKKGVYKIIVQFLTDAEGNVSEVKALNYQNTKMAQHCIDVVQKGPRWEPAVQSGRKVKAYRNQPITFVVE